VVPAEDVEAGSGYFILKASSRQMVYEALFATVDIIAQEQVARIGRKPAVFEQPQQVIVLSMDIACNNVNCTADPHRSLELDEAGLAHENLTSCVAQTFDLLLFEGYELAWLAHTHPE
jgi:hypothetical protein